MRVHVVDPSAFTPAYDHALAGALARAGADVELITSRFGYGAVMREEGYAVRERFYRLRPGFAGGRIRRAAKLAQHVPDMVAYRHAAREADVVHFQWMALQQADLHLLRRDRPLVLTAHDVLPRQPHPGQLAAQRRLYERADAIVVHSLHGRHRLIDALDVDSRSVHVIPHGAFDHLTRLPWERPLPRDLAAVRGPVVLCFGLMRPYKGLDVLLEAWRGIDGAELWVVGMPKMRIGRLMAKAPRGVRFVPRYVSEPEIPAFFRRADLVVLPYRQIDQSGVLFTALAFGRPLLLSDVGGFPEVATTGAAELVAPGDAEQLRAAMLRLIEDDARRRALGEAAARAASEVYSWDRIAERTLGLYRSFGVAVEAPSQARRHAIRDAA
jgi:glycosyltransferase involved in cell wall biosynthesis